MSGDRTAALCCTEQQHSSTRQGAGRAAQGWFEHYAHLRIRFHEKLQEALAAAAGEKALAGSAGLFWVVSVR
jgi:hypothetical protein